MVGPAELIQKSVETALEKSNFIAKGLPPLEIPARGIVRLFPKWEQPRGDLGSQESGVRIPNRR